MDPDGVTRVVPIRVMRIQTARIQAMRIQVMRTRVMRIQAVRIQGMRTRAMRIQAVRIHARRFRRGDYPCECLRITARNASPYRLSLTDPTPLSAASASLSAGRCSTISRKVES